MNKNLICLILIIFSSLGPYVGFGLRLEHLFIYGFFLFIFISFLVKAKLSESLLLILLPLLFSFVVALFFDLITGPKTRVGNLFANIDNLLEPVILIFVFSYFMNNNFDENDFKILLSFVIKMGILASLVSVTTIFFNIEFFLKYFVTGIDDELGLWKQVYSLGRFTGIFAQPLEAGIYFSCCLFSLIYYFKQYGMKNFRFWLSFTMIFIGGILSLSKNFYLLGVFLAFFLYGQLSGWTLKKYFFIFSILFITVLILFTFLFLDLGNYLNTLISIYDSDGLASAVTAGRFGGESMTDVELLFDKFYNDGFFMGFGLGTHLPLDNGFLEYAYQGGFFALLGYMLFIILGILTAFLKRKRMTSKFLLVLMIYIFLSSVGGPVITANRGNIIIIFLISAIVALTNNKTITYVKK